MAPGYWEASLPSRKRPIVVSFFSSCGPSWTSAKTGDHRRLQSQTLTAPKERKGIEKKRLKSNDAHARHIYYRLNNPSK
jgi:hypothetical protein